jgi:S-adenosylmethionine:tRNA ribosyltransferase-isomerase
MPSAGRPFTGQTLGDLRRRGVGIASLTHAAGLSSTGDPALDALLPLPERYELPAATVAAIEHTHASSHRVIAVGTTVARALEGCHATHGRLVPGTGVTDLLLGPDQVLHVVDGIVTGMHEPTESHYRLLTAFVAEPALRAAVDHAIQHGYQGHELGDVTLVL